jgi:hypothetical protein
MDADLVLFPGDGTNMEECLAASMIDATDKTHCVWGAWGCGHPEERFALNQSVLDRPLAL